MEHKHTPHYIKAIKDRTVTGVFSVFGNLDSYNDRMQPGSFTKTIQERGGRILHLWQHDMQAPPIARITNLREIPRAELPADVLRDFPDASGGAEVTREYLDTPRANEVLTAIKSEMPLQMSFAFDALKYDFEEDPDAKYEWDRVRNVREVRLWETSDVNWGANEATTASKADTAVLLRQIYGLLKQLKALPRTAHDTALLNDIAALAADLHISNTELDDAATRRAVDLTTLPLRSRLAKHRLTLAQRKHT